MNLHRSFVASKIPRPPLSPHSEAWRSFARLDLEIGAGNGMFAESYCAANPSRALISLERTLLRSRALLARQHENLFSYRADAVNFVTHFIDLSSLDRVFILYPNPYPKSKQANLRWHNMPFMECLNSRLRVGGELTLATNILSYRNEALEVMCTQWGLELLASEAFAGEPRTAFEKKYLARGETCWNLVFRKIY